MGICGGRAFVLVGLSFLTNQYVKFTGYILAALLLFILWIHLPNYLNAGDKEWRQMALINLYLKIQLYWVLPYMWLPAHTISIFHLEEADWGIKHN